MKKKSYNVLITAACMFMLFSCTAEKAAAAAPKDTSVKALAPFGFHIYEEPVDPSELTLTDLKGKTITNADFTGNITLLNFWASWCPPCRSEMPSIDNLHKAMQGKNFNIVAVNVGEKKDHLVQFIADAGYTFPVYLDEKAVISGMFASRGIPITYLLNKEGDIIAVRPGAMEYDQPKLIEIFKGLADE